MSLLTIILIILGVVALFLIILHYWGRDKESSPSTGYQFEDSGDGAIKSGFNKLLACCGFR